MKLLVLFLALALPLRAAELSRVRHHAGAISYLEVVDSERSARDAARALGGGGEHPGLPAAIVAQK